MSRLSDTKERLLDIAYDIDDSADDLENLLHEDGEAVPDTLREQLGLVMWDLRGSWRALEDIHHRM